MAVRRGATCGPAGVPRCVCCGPAGRPVPGAADRPRSCAPSSLGRQFPHADGPGSSSKWGRTRCAWSDAEILPAPRTPRRGQRRGAVATPPRPRIGAWLRGTPVRGAASSHSDLRSTGTPEDIGDGRGTPGLRSLCAERRTLCSHAPSPLPPPRPDAGPGGGGARSAPAAPPKRLSGLPAPHGPLLRARGCGQPAPRPRAQSGAVGSAKTAGTKARLSPGRNAAPGG